MRTNLPCAVTVAAALILVALFGLLYPVTVAGQSRTPFYWESIDVFIDVQPNGDMIVSETHTYAFTAPHNNRRYRYIPLDRVDLIDDISVSMDGRILRSSTGIKDGNLWISWEHRPLDPPETLTFVLRYRVQGGLHVDVDGRDLVYWKALFKDRDADILGGAVTVRLPDALVGTPTAVRSYGAPAEVARIDVRTVRFTAERPLPPGEELEVHVGFSHGLLPLAKPEWQRSWVANAFGTWRGWAIAAGGAVSGLSVSSVLRAYPNNPAALRVMRAQAK